MDLAYCILAVVVGWAGKVAVLVRWVWGRCVGGMVWWCGEICGDGEWWEGFDGWEDGGVVEAGV